MAAVKRRRLGDLYVRGKMLEPNDGTGEPVKVWMAKLNEIDRETAMRRANAVKARYMIEADNEDSETFIATYAEVRAIDDRDDLVAYIITEDLTKARRRIEAQRATDEESWGKEDYLQGLVDAWTGVDGESGLAAVFAEDPEDPEAIRVEKELARFEDEVRVAMGAEVERLTKDWADVSLDDLRRKVAHKLLEVRAGEQFAREFRRQQMFFALRDPVNRHQRYFERVAEVDDLDDDLREYLTEQYDGMVVEGAEGKGSPPVPTSSTSSESSESTLPSGPETAAA